MDNRTVAFVSLGLVFGEHEGQEDIISGFDIDLVAMSMANRNDHEDLIREELTEALRRIEAGILAARNGSFVCAFPGH